MSKSRSIARHRAMPTRTNPLVTAGRAVGAGASVAGKPAAVVVAASGLLLGAALPASAAGEISFASTGQTVATTSAATSAPAGSYTVRSGDTLSSIAAAHGVSVDTLFTANGLGHNSVIYPGQSIALSGSAVSQHSVQVATAAPAVATPAVVAPAVATPAVVAPAVATPAVSAPVAAAQTNGNSTGISTQSASIGGVTATAMRGVGSGYVYGGTAYGAWDCSGFVQWVYAQHGISLPRTTWSQFAALRPTGNPQPGDLVSQNGGNHVGIYLGNGQMVSALNPAQGTQVHSVNVMSVDGYYTR